MNTLIETAKAWAKADPFRTEEDDLPLERELFNWATHFPVVIQDIYRSDTVVDEVVVVMEGGISIHIPI